MTFQDRLLIGGEFVEAQLPAWGFSGSVASSFRFAWIPRNDWSQFAYRLTLLAPEQLTWSSSTCPTQLPATCETATSYSEGFTHLIPFAAGHEIIRQGRRC